MKTIFTVGIVSAVLAASADAASPAWVYLPGEGVISNDNAVGVSKDWVLNVSVLDAARRELAVGRGGTPGSAFVERDGAIAGGATLDLSEPVADADGARWTITTLNYACLKSASSPLVEFTAPRELVTFGGQVFNYDPAALKNATFDCPQLTAWGDWGFAVYATLRVVAPKLKEIGEGGVYKMDWTDLSEWNLDGVETVGGQAFRWAHPQGTLRLPRLKAMGWGCFKNAFLTRMELGNCRNTLETVGASAFDTSTCREIVLGGAEGFTVGAGGFGATNLERVWMTGAVPTFTGEGVVFGTESHAAKSMVFYVPDTEAWAAVRAGATKLTEEERAQFAEAHPGWDVPFGVVGADVFRTQNEQYVGTARPSDLGFMPRVFVGSRSAGQYGDAWKVTVDGEEADGEVPYGATVTVTALPAKAASTTVSWEGRLPDGTTPTGTSFTFQATEDVALYARFSHVWEYDAETSPQTISDGFWTLAVKSESARGLVLGVVNASERADGRTAPPWAFLADAPEEMRGELDLSSPVYEKGRVGEEAARWTIVRNGDKAFQNDSRVTSFYSPVGGFVQWNSQVFNGATALTNAVLNLPDMAGSIAPWGWEFNRCALARFVLNAPQMTALGSSSSASTFNAATFADSDAGEWNLAGVKTLANAAFRAGGSGGVGPTGDLVLPNVETVGDRAFGNWRRVTSAALGTNGTLKTLGAYVFENNAEALKRLDFGTSSAFTAAETAFLANETTPLPVEEAWFAGEAPSAETLDRLLALRTAGEDGAKPVTLFVPMAAKGWRAVCSPFTEAEEAAARALRREKGLRVLGVYETQDGRRAAWLVQRPDIPYRPGLIIRIR